MKRKKRALALFILLMFIASLTMSACGGEDPANEPAAENLEPIVISLEGGDWGFPNPFAHQPRKWGSFYKDFIFDTLLYEDEEGTIPWLATEWEVEDEGKKYIFDLRKDVKWQDGEVFTADDVVFTFNYYKEKNNQLYDISSIKSVKKLNDYKVEFAMKEPLLLSINRVFLATNIVPKHIWENVDDPKKFHTTNPEEAVIGCGPYILADYQKEQGTYRFIRNEDFWGGVPRVAEIRTIPTSQPLLSLLNGEIAECWINTQELDSLKDKPQFEVVKSPPFKMQWLCFNLKDPILGDLKFRHALAHAIDQQEVLDRISMGHGETGSQGVVPKSHSFYNPDVKDYEYNPEKAGEMLDELGYKDTDADGIREDKNGKALKFELLATAEGVRSAELIKTQLNKVGVDLEIKSNQRNKVDELTRQGKFQIVLEWGGMMLLARDPDFLRSYFVPQEKRSFFSAYAYNNPDFNELAEKQKTELDSDKRKAMLFEMQEILSEDIPNYYICGESVYYAYNKEIYDGWFTPANSTLIDSSKLVYTRGKKAE